MLNKKVDMEVIKLSKEKEFVFYNSILLPMKMMYNSKDYAIMLNGYLN